MPQPTAADQLAIRSPTAWMAVLEHARQIGDTRRANEAIRQLRQLGVEVRFVEEAHR